MNEWFDRASRVLLPVLCMIPKPQCINPFLEKSGSTNLHLSFLRISHIPDTNFFISFNISCLHRL